MTEKTNPPLDRSYEPPPPPPYSEYSHTPSQGPYPMPPPGTSYRMPSPHPPHSPQVPYTAPPTAPDSKSRGMPGDTSPYTGPPYPGEQQARDGPSPYQQDRLHGYQQPNGYGYTSPGVGSSSGASSSRGSGGLLGGLLGGGGAPQRDPLNPPPPCFSRPPRFHYQPPPFHRMQIPGNGKSLDEGFPTIYPDHAFNGHDVEASDWVRFVQDLAISGRLDRRQNIKANVTPMFIGGGLALGMLMTRGIKNKMKAGKDQQVGALVDIWNGYYFNPRAINITLVRGTIPLSGSQAPLDGDSASSSSSSSSSDSSDYECPPGMSKRDEKRYRREQKRADKRERRDQKRLQRDERRKHKRSNRNKDPYFLVIEYMPPSTTPSLPPMY
ncbi:hypothetical protein VKS41_006898 [Umbelopsis sp. WA50703]